MRRIYLDYASLTPVDKGVIKEMKKYMNEDFMNPSALYSSAVNSKKAIEKAKKIIADIIHAHPDEIVFTSGGTESNQLVLNNKINKKIIISSIEHSSIIENDNYIHIPVSKEGIIDLDKLKESITSDTTLVSIMLVNNEIGIIEPIHDIAKIVRDARKKFNSPFPLLHTDASQAGNSLELFVEKMGIDFMTLDGSKIYGPRGCGILFVKRNTMQIIRKGTENLPAIMGFAYALSKSQNNLQKENIRIKEIRDYFISEMMKLDKDIKINGSLKDSIPNILNISIPNIDSEFFVLQLDAKGIECSTKSACLRDQDESYVLKEIKADSKTSIRFSFGRFTKKTDIKKVIKEISKILQKR